MPLYEFYCNNCKKRFELRIAYPDYGRKTVLCCHCGSSNVRRQINRFRLKRSEANRLVDLPDPKKLAGLENDPQSLGKMIRTMSKDTGEDLGPEFNEVVDRLESGQSASDIERSMPNMEDDDRSSGMESD